MSFASLIAAQRIHVVPSFTLECGQTLHEVPVAYKTWGNLNESKDNVMVICHAFTGSADVDDWWGPLMGRGKAFDSHRFYIFCANVLGSPYGTASPVTTDPATGRPYGPEFPPTTIRDDVRLHKLVLDHLGVRSVAVVIGGSMGGMATLEWPLCTPAGFVRHIVPLATAARHSAWCISWGEAQRQSIYSDPEYRAGFYAADAQPRSGLAAARMAALLTYRSRDSFESRFGRSHRAPAGRAAAAPASPSHLSAHNDGLRRLANGTGSGAHAPASRDGSPQRPPIFSAQSYLRYQGEKFNSRFDANCYIHITRKLDTHDLARGRGRGGAADDADDAGALADALARLPRGTLVISIQTDGLFTPSEQRELADGIPDAELVTIDSPDGHDGFLLEFEQINTHILRFLRRSVPEIYVASSDGADAPEDNDFVAKQTSMFGEAEVNVTMW